MSEDGNLLEIEEGAMSTLHRIRELASVAVVVVGAVIATIAPAGVALASESSSHGREIANLGHLTVLASRSVEITDLGSLTVTASRLPDVQVADLGAMTVFATGIRTVKVASKRSAQSWN
jgi:hypothetical protein